MGKCENCTCGNGCGCSAPQEKECSFCNEHEKGDELYEMSSWDGGIGFDYIRNIQYCPMCGKELSNE